MAAFLRIIRFECAYAARREVQVRGLTLPLTPDADFADEIGRVRRSAGGYLCPAFGPPSGASFDV